MPSADSHHSPGLTPSALALQHVPDSDIDEQMVGARSVCVGTVAWRNGAIRIRKVCEVRDTFFPDPSGQLATASAKQVSAPKTPVCEGCAQRESLPPIHRHEYRLIGSRVPEHCCLYSTCIAHDRLQRMTDSNSTEGNADAVLSRHGLYGADLGCPAPTVDCGFRHATRRSGRGGRCRCSLAGWTMQRPHFGAAASRGPRRRAGQA